MIAALQLPFPDPICRTCPREPEPYSDEARVLHWLQRCPVAVSREALAFWTELPDRAVRRAIANLVAAGFPVVSTSDAAGYKLATEPDELDHSIRELASRELALRERRQALLRAQAGMRAGG